MAAGSLAGDGGRGKWRGRGGGCRGWRYAVVVVSAGWPGLLVEGQDPAVRRNGATAVGGGSRLHGVGRNGWVFGYCGRPRRGQGHVAPCSCSHSMAALRHMRFGNLHVRYFKFFF